MCANAARCAILLILAAAVESGATLSPTPGWGGTTATTMRLWRKFEPYLAAAARVYRETGQPPWRPVSDVWPGLVAAADWPDEFLVGPDFVVVARLPRPNQLSGMIDVRLWIPPGRWRNWYTGLTLDGPAEALVPVQPGDEALFVRDGAIIPTPPWLTRSTDVDLDTTVLHCLRGDRGAAFLYREAPPGDPAGAGYEWTPVRQYAGDGVRRIVIGPTVGRDPRSPPERNYEVRLPDEWPALEVLVDGVTLAPAVEPGHVGWWYDAVRLTSVVRLPPVKLGDEITIDVLAGDTGLPDAGLEQGLRGLYRIVDAARRDLGDRAPPGIDALVRLRAALASEPETMVSFDRALPLYWQFGLRELSEMELPAAARYKWTMRLLGLSIAPEARRARDSNSFEIRIRVATVAPFGDISEMTARVSCTAVPPPASSPVAAGDAAGFAAGIPQAIEFSRPAPPGDTPPRFRADVELTVLDFSISLPLEFSP